MIRGIGTLLLLLVATVTGSAQASAADTAAVAAVLAAELSGAGQRLIVSDEGLGPRVATVLGQSTVRPGPAPRCPRPDGGSRDAAVLVSIRLMALSASEARVHVDTSCRPASPRPRISVRVVRYELKKVDGGWQVVARQPLFVT